MKVVLNILCWVLVAVCCYFPFAYNHSDMDRMEVRSSHILVDTQEEALNIKKEIVEKKASFEEMAEKYSKCDSKKDKGDIGYTLRGRVVPEYDKVAYTAKINEINDPVKSEHGWHLIKVTEIKHFSDKENFSRRYF